LQTQTDVRDKYHGLPRTEDKLYIWTKPEVEIQKADFRLIRFIGLYWLSADTKTVCEMLKFSPAGEDVDRDHNPVVATVAVN